LANSIALCSSRNASAISAGRFFLAARVVTDADGRGFGIDDVQVVADRLVRGLTFLHQLVAGQVLVFWMLLMSFS